MLTMSVLGNLVIAILLIVLIWYFIKALPFMAPYGNMADIAAVIFVVIVCIMAFTGRNPVRIVLLDYVRMLS